MYYCSLLITFANRLDPVQARQNVGLHLGPKYLALERIIQKSTLRKKSADDKQKHAKLPSSPRVNQSKKTYTFVPRSV